MVRKEIFYCSTIRKLSKMSFKISINICKSAYNKIETAATSTQFSNCFIMFSVTSIFAAIDFERFNDFITLKKTAIYSEQIGSFYEITQLTSAVWRQNNMVQRRFYSYTYTYTCTHVYAYTFTHLTSLALINAINFL